MAISGTYDQEHPTTLEIKPSPIHGHGVFALTSFASGELIMSSFGENYFEVTNKHPQAFGSNTQYTTPLESRHSGKNRPNRNLIVYMPTNEFRFLNHNAANSNIKVLDNFKTYATQDIAIGEELTLNYNHIGYYD